MLGDNGNGAGYNPLAAQCHHWSTRRSTPLEVAIQHRRGNAKVRDVATLIEAAVQKEGAKAADAQMGMNVEN